MKNIIKKMQETRLKNFSYEDLEKVAEIAMQNLSDNPTNEEIKKEIERQENIHFWAK